MSSVIVILSTIPEHPKNWLTLLSEYVIVLFPEYIVPVCSNPIVESTDITEAPILTFSKTFELGVIVKLPWTLLLSPYPTNNPILKYCFCPLVNISTEDIEAFVAESVDLVNVCPTIFVISPLIDSATHIPF